MVVGGRHAGSFSLSLSPRYKRFFVASTPAARFFVATATRISPPVLPLIFGVILFCAHVIINTSARSYQVFSPDNGSLSNGDLWIFVRFNGDDEREKLKLDSLVNRIICTITM